MKIMTTIRIDADIYQKAKELNLNFSEITENALRDIIQKNSKLINIDKEMAQSDILNEASELIKYLDSPFLLNYAKETYKKRGLTDAEINEIIKKAKELADKMV